MIASGVSCAFADLTVVVPLQFHLCLVLTHRPMAYTCSLLYQKIVNVYSY